MLICQALDWTPRLVKDGLFFFFLGVHTAIEEPPGKVTEYLLAAPIVRFFPRTAHAEGGTQESLLIKSLA